MPAYLRKRLSYLFVSSAVLLTLIAVTVRQERIWRDPFTLWSRELRIYPGFSAYYHLAIEYLMAGDNARAGYYYTKAIELNPANDRLYNGRGMIYMNTGDLGHAIEDFSRSIELRPNSSAYNNRGLAHELNGDYAGAIEDYKMAVTLIKESKDSIAYYNLGLAYMKTGDNNGAEANFRKAYASGIKDAAAYLTR